MTRFTVMWYGPDQIRHAECIDAVNRTAAVGAVLRLNPAARSAWIVAARPAVPVDGA
ncbi:MAG: hypothetical protein KGL39_29790 [Patescibacteria group bacterium]|nr:hypothetical protein [Patescibacteria group bacterium]